MALALVPPVKEVGEVGELETIVLEDPLNEEGLLESGGAVKAGGAIVRFTTEQPPGLPADTIPVLIGKGFGGSEAAYARFRSELAALENAATTYKTPRTLGDQNPERMQSKAMWAVGKQLGQVADTFKVDLVTHSASAWTGANVARRNPHAVRNLVIVGGAGITGHNMLSLIPGAAKLAMNIVREIPRFRDLEYTRDEAIEIARHNFINPVRSLGEMAVASGCDSREILADLGFLGINVSILQFEEDELFKTSKVERFAGEAGINLVVLQKLGHTAPILEPKMVAEAVNNILKA